MKLHMGCGLIKKTEFVNIDIDPKCKPDYVLDVSKPLPFPDDSVEYILADNLWEHIGDDFIPMMIEWHRVSKKGAVWHIRVPHVDSHAAFQDPTHKRFFCEETFDYFNKKHDRWKHYGKGYGIPPFNILKFKKEERFIDCKMEVVK